jgi:hypothetical protein
MDNHEDDLKDFFSALDIKILEFITELKQQLKEERQSGTKDPSYWEQIGEINKLVAIIHDTAVLRKNLAGHEALGQDMLEHGMPLMVSSMNCPVCKKKTNWLQAREEKNERNWMCNRYLCPQCKTIRNLGIPNNWPDYYQFLIYHFYQPKSKAKKKEKDVKDENSQEEHENDMKIVRMLKKFEKNRLSKIKMIKKREKVINQILEMLCEFQDSIIKVPGIFDSLN